MTRKERGVRPAGEQQRAARGAGADNEENLALRMLQVLEMDEVR
jgi:hypothetical protein